MAKTAGMLLRRSARQTRRDKPAEGKTCVVTVGTTRFEELIRVSSGKEFAEALVKKGFGKLLLQVGSGSVPRAVGAGAAAEGRDGGEYVHETGLAVSWFRFRPEFGNLIASADLVVSHAGSGSIFEALGSGRALIVVVNTALMDNHQAELANRLAADGHLVASTCEELCGALDALDESELLPYTPGNASDVAQEVIRVLLSP